MDARVLATRNRCQLLGSGGFNLLLCNSLGFLSSSNVEFRIASIIDSFFVNRNNGQLGNPRPHEDSGPAVFADRYGSGILSLA